MNSSQYEADYTANGSAEKGEKMTAIEEKTQKAYRLGHNAFRTGIERFPTNDPEFIRLLGNQPFQEWMVKYSYAWLNGWDAANLQAEVL